MKSFMEQQMPPAAVADLVHDAVIGDDDTRGFIADANPAALREIAQRLEEAIERGLWQPRSNSARAQLAELA